MMLRQSGEGLRLAQAPQRPDCHRAHQRGRMREPPDNDGSERAIAGIADGDQHVA